MNLKEAREVAAKVAKRDGTVSINDLDIKGPAAGSVFRDSRFEFAGHYTRSINGHKDVKVWKLVGSAVKAVISDLDILFIVDASGSMFDRVNEAVRGINSFVQEQTHGVRISLSFFDTRRGYQEYCNNVTPDEFELIRFRTGGLTPLYDSIGTGIDQMSDSKNDVTIIIVTDGQENNSHKYTKPSIMAKIQAKQKDGWNFISIGSGFDVVKAHKGTGIKTETTVQTRDFEKCLKLSAQKVTKYRATGQSKNLSYTNYEREILK